MGVNYDDNAFHNVRVVKGNLDVHDVAVVVPCVPSVIVRVLFCRVNWIRSASYTKFWLLGIIDTY